MSFPIFLLQNQETSVCCSAGASPWRCPSPKNAPWSCECVRVNRNHVHSLPMAANYTYCSPPLCASQNKWRLAVSRCSSCEQKLNKFKRIRLIAAIVSESKASIQVMRESVVLWQHGYPPGTCFTASHIASTQLSKRFCWEIWATECKQQGLVRVSMFSLG